MMRHPAALQWLKQNIKSVTCRPGPPASNPTAKMTLANGNLTFTPDPAHNTSSVTAELWSSSTSARDQGKTMKKLAGLHLARRLWELDQALRAAETKANEACGSKLSLTVDVPSWQAGGTQTGAAGTPLTKWLTGYFPDQSVESICGDFMKTVARACRDGHKQAVQKKLSRVVCRYAGTRR